MATIEGAGVPLSVHEHPVAAGTPQVGRTAVVVHGIAADASAEAELATGLADAGIRTVTYDRRGYGASGAPEPYDGTTVEEQAQDLIAVIDALQAAPALLVGDGFGALVCLDVVKRRPELVAAAVLADPPLLAFVPAATDLLARQQVMIEQALREGGSAAAIDAWLGEGADPRRRERAQASPHGFFADYAGQASWEVTRRELRACTTPLGVVTGPVTTPEVLAAADALAELVPGAQRARDGEVLALARLLA